MIDGNLLLSEDQDISAVASTILSTHSFDQGVGGTLATGGTANGNIGAGKPLYLNMVLTEAVASGGAAEVEFQLVSADDDALTSNLVVLKTSGAISKAALILGYRPLICGSLPSGIGDRYIGCRYIITTNTTTTGTVSAWLSPDPVQSPT